MDLLTSLSLHSARRCCLFPIHPQGWQLLTSDCEDNRLRIADELDIMADGCHISCSTRVKINMLLNTGFFAVGYNWKYRPLKPWVFGLVSIAVNHQQPIFRLVPDSKAGTQLPRIMHHMQLNSTIVSDEWQGTSEFHEWGNSTWRHKTIWCTNNNKLTSFVWQRGLTALI